MFRKYCTENITVSVRSKWENMISKHLEREFCWHFCVSPETMSIIKHIERWRWIKIQACCCDVRQPLLHTSGFTSVCTRQRGSIRSFLHVNALSVVLRSTSPFRQDQAPSTQSISVLVSGRVTVVRSCSCLIDFCGVSCPSWMSWMLAEWRYNDLINGTLRNIKHIEKPFLQGEITAVFAVSFARFGM